MVTMTCTRLKKKFIVLFLLTVSILKLCCLTQ